MPIGGPGRRSKSEEDLVVGDTYQSEVLSELDKPVNLNEAKMAEVPFKPHINFFTNISRNNVSNPDQQILSVAAVSKVLQDQYELGYTVMSVQFTGFSSTNDIGMFYFLKHRDA